MQVETNSLRLFREVAISDHIDGWRVCWIGGWDKEKSIAVLLFTNLSMDPENEFFADGITEEIINALALLPSSRRRRVYT